MRWIASAAILLLAFSTLQQGAAPGPTADSVYFSTSSDGLAWETGKLLSAKASVPDVIYTSKSVYWAYWVDFSDYKGPLTESIGIAKSEDGANWERLGAVQFEGLNGIVPVDPDVIELPDGRLRIYFFDIAKSVGEHPIYSAISSDGIRFVLEEGVRFQKENIFDPDVIRLPDGRYRMHLNDGGRISSATSPDGLTFTADEGLRLQQGSVPGSIVLDDESIRLYACVNGISAFRSTDGLSFLIERERVIPSIDRSIVCDPSVTKTPTGYLLVYKVRAAN